MSSCRPICARACSPRNNLDPLTSYTWFCGPRLAAELFCAGGPGRGASPRENAVVPSNDRCRGLEEKTCAKVTRQMWGANIFCRGCKRTAKKFAPILFAPVRAVWMPEIPPLWEREKLADESWAKTAEERQSLYRLHRNEGGMSGKKLEDCYFGIYFASISWRKE